MEKLETTQEQKSMAVALTTVLVAQDADFSFEILSAVFLGLREYKEKIDKQKQNINTIVRNIKPEHLAEMRKVIIPEVFENVGIHLK